MIDPTNVFRHSLWPRPGSPGQERLLGEDDVKGKTVRELMDGPGGRMVEEAEGRGAGAARNGKGKMVPGLTESHPVGQGVRQ